MKDSVSVNFHIKSCNNLKSVKATKNVYDITNIYKVKILYINWNYVTGSDFH